MTPTRRGFLATAAAPLAVPAPNSSGWFDRPMRWSQLTLVEDDPEKFDPDFWLAYFARLRSDAVCLSAGGIVAYYPTEIELHHRSRWLDKFRPADPQFRGDPFGYLVAGCRRAGMVVIARTDPHAVLDDVARAHPNWIAVDAQGKPRRHWADPERWVTCALGPYNFDFMTRVHREIVTRYRVDGIFSNRWTGSGQCYCEHCRRLFRDATGFDLPRTTDPSDRARREYIGWRQARLFELWRRWDAEIRRINPEARFIANSGGGALSELDMKKVGELADILFADRQARRGLMVPWANGKNGKEYRATLGRKPIGGIFSVGIEEPYRWKDSVQTEAEIRIWVADGVANGLRPWYTKFSGTIHDPRWLAPVERIYQRLARWEPYLRNESPIAEVALIYSQQTAAYYGGPAARARVEDHTQGFYQALVEARIPFEMVHDGLLDYDRVRRYRALILPNIAALSDRQCGQLREFVARGGGLVATYETSLYDEWGARRPDFGLGDLFGARYAGRVEGPMQNSYLRLEHAANPGHPLLEGLRDAPRIINATHRVVVEPTRLLARAPLTLIPSYPDLPMEMVFPRRPQTDIAEVYLREQGGGRVAYFPSNLDRTYWEVLAHDHGLLLRNAVDWATLGERPLYVAGPGLLDVTAWRQQRSITVHLVNLTNPMAMKGPYREILPVGEQRVRLRLAEGDRPQRVHLLAAERPAEFAVRGGWLETVVGSVHDHEVVAIDLG